MTELVPKEELGRSSQFFVPEKIINIQVDFIGSHQPLLHEIADEFIQTGLFSTPALYVCILGTLNGEQVLVPVSDKKTSYGTARYKADQKASATFKSDIRRQETGCSLDQTLASLVILYRGITPICPNEVW